ncbi:MAG: hypothetical protein GY913_35890 [Proteobacteria bacterium]|nr:hypothetical protein [Pseudomonadota bacterium]MCP4922313.1 hypothetical protein [Pseudomonadota bacterium]
MTFQIGLFEGLDGDTPGPEVAADYHEMLGSPDLPVLSDTQGLLLKNTPYNGRSLPGKCLLSPEMEILYCMSGHDGLDDMYGRIEDDLAQ